MNNIHNLNKFPSYEDLPFKLGHVSVDGMKKTLKQESTAGFIADSKSIFIQNQHKKPGLPSFYWKIDSNQV